MKKLLSVLLSLVMLCSLFAGVTASAADINPYPVIFVNGLATSDIVNTETGETVFPFSGEGVTDAVKNVIKPLLSAVLLGKYDKMGPAVIELANALFGDMACDENGNPVLPTDYDPDDHIDLTQDFKKY
ncbi:MAG: hypothetical protein K6C36_01765, partial [Clostridia bacterium]|nr:hypothetical protein [Clostridia bacterium]